MSAPPGRARGPGRRSKLTDVVQEKICMLVRAGHYKKVAAQQAGIEERTLYEWVGKGNRNHPQYRRRYAIFAEELEKAEADSEVILLDGIVRDGGPREKLEVLKRRFPERWGDRHRLEHATPDGPLQHHHSGRIDGQGNTAAVQIIIACEDDLWNETDDAAATKDHDRVESERAELFEEEQKKVSMPSDSSEYGD